MNNMKKVFLIIFLLNLYFTYSCNKNIGNQTHSNVFKDTVAIERTADTQYTGKSKAPLGKIIESLPTQEKIIALTFDACEYKKPSYFDTTILNYIINEKIPVTIFVSGRFAKRNSDLLKSISQYQFIEIENHSLSHYNHTEKLTKSEIEYEVLENEKIIMEITGKRTKFFRFPAGNYNQKSLAVLKDLDYPVIHWTFASGDYDKKMTTQKLYRRVINNIQPGCILIFHINGNGHGTQGALPYIIDFLRKNDYQLVKLEDIFE